MFETSTNDLGTFNFANESTFNYNSYNNRNSQKKKQPNMFLKAAGGNVTNLLDFKKPTREITSERALHLLE